MSVVVYPRLAALLEERRISVAELGRRIEAHYGLRVDVMSLARLAETAPVRQADLEAAGATAAVLGLKLDDLFIVAAVAEQGENAEEWQFSESADSKRLGGLLKKRLDGPLSDEDLAELETLVARHGVVEHERGMEARARQRGVPVEQVRRETETQLAAARAWWDTYNVTADQDRILAESDAAPDSR